MPDKRIFLTHVDLRRPRTGCMWPHKSPVHDRSWELLPVPYSSTSGMKSQAWSDLWARGALSHYWQGVKKTLVTRWAEMSFLLFCINVHHVSVQISNLVRLGLSAILAHCDRSCWEATHLTLLHSFFFTVRSIWRDSALPLSCGQRNTRSMELHNACFQCARGNKMFSKVPLLSVADYSVFFTFTKYMGDIVKIFISNCKEKCHFLADSGFFSQAMCEKQSTVLTHAIQVAAFPILTSARDWAIPEAKQCSDKLVTRAGSDFRNELYRSLGKVHAV